MTEHLKDTTPLGKSVEQVEQESGETHGDTRTEDTRLGGFSLNPEPSIAEERDDSNRTGADNTSLLGKTLLLGDSDQGHSRSPDADQDTSDSSEA